MAETIKIFKGDPANGGTLIDTINTGGPVNLNFASGSGLTYTKNGQDMLIDWIEGVVQSSADPSSLGLQIVDGEDWELQGEEKYKITGPTTNGGLRWVYNSNNSMTVTVWYPSRDGSVVAWGMNDYDQPPAVLKVVVKRIP